MHNKKSALLCVCCTALDARRKKENVRICYERFVVFVMVLFLCQMIELSHAANPTHAIAAPINANIYFLLSFLICRCLFKPLYSEYFGWFSDEFCQKPSPECCHCYLSFRFSLLCLLSEDGRDDTSNDHCGCSYSECYQTKCDHILSSFHSSLVIVSVVYYPKIVEMMPPTIIDVVVTPSIT